MNTKLKPTKKNLLDVNIFNSSNIAKRAGALLYFSWQAPMGGRVYQPAGWHVIGVEFQTNPDGHYSDYGQKFFMVTDVKEQKQAKLLEAMSWAHEKFLKDHGFADSFDDFVGSCWRDPFGAWHLPGVKESLEAFLNGDIAEHERIRTAHVKASITAQRSETQRRREEQDAHNAKINEALKFLNAVQIRPRPQDRDRNSLFTITANDLFKIVDTIKGENGKL